MSKKFAKATKKPRRPRKQIVALATSTNVALQQVAAELDEVKRVIAALVNATGTEAKVLELLGRTPAPAPESPAPSEVPAQ